MGDLLKLAKKLEELAKGFDKSSGKTTEKIALTILGQLVYSTPVDSSKALSNWQLNVGSPIKFKIDAYFPGEFGSSQKQSAQAALEAAKKALQGRKSGEPIYITNNLPYINRLNDGHSKQTTPGFIERAILLGRRSVRGQK